MQRSSAKNNDPRLESRARLTSHRSSSRRGFWLAAVDREKKKNRQNKRSPCLVNSKIATANTNNLNTKADWTEKKKQKKEFGFLANRCESNA